MLSLIRALGNRNAGFVLGMVVVANLAIGSLLMDRYPELYPPFFPNELDFFFDPVRIEHAWLYALLLTFSLFGVNLLATVIDSAVGIARTGDRRTKPLAALAFHTALVSILLAHLHDGFYGSSYQEVLGEEEVEIPGVGFVRVEAVESRFHPDGSLKDTEARLFFRLEDGRQTRKTIAYNEPALFDGGNREVIIQQGGREPSGVIVTRASDGAEIRLTRSTPRKIGEDHLILRSLYMSEMDLPIAEFRLLSPEGRKRLFMVLDERAGHHARLDIADDLYHYKDLITVPRAMVMVRHNPSIPLILGGLLFSILGTLLLMRWIWIRRKPNVM